MLNIAVIQFALKYWKPIAVVLSVLGLFGGGYLKGHSDAAGKCHDKELQTKIAVLERDAQVQKTADAFEQATLAKSQDEALKRNKELEAYVDELHNQAVLEQALPEPKPTIINACGLTANDVKRLRNIDK